jgi:hypothetical protein
MLVAIVAIAVGLIVWLATRSGSGSSTAASSPATTVTQTAAQIPPLLLTSRVLRSMAGALQQPVYWAGPQAGHRYELRRAANGDIVVRYLPAGVQAGDKRALLSVGTYPFRGAFADEQRLAKRNGWIAKKLAGGWIAVYRRSRPTNIYLARPRFDYQIEVFDPSPTKARQLVVSGRLQRVR